MAIFLKFNVTPLLLNAPSPALKKFDYFSTGGRDHLLNLRAGKSKKNKIQNTNLHERVSIRFRSVKYIATDK